MGKDNQYRNLKKNYKSIAYKTNLMWNAVETKTIGATVNSTLLEQDSVPICLNAIAQGNTATTRIGNDITMTYLRIKIALHSSDWDSSQAGEYETNIVRFFIIYDEQPNGGTITETVLFGATTNTHVALFDPPNKSRYKVLYDQSYSINITQSVKPVNIEIPLHQLKTYYNAAGAASTSIETGTLWLFAISDSAGAPSPSMDYSFQTHFIDL